MKTSLPGRALAAALALAAAAAAGSPLHAQADATVVVGQVIDAETRTPLAGVSIEVPGTRTQAVTGTDGQFTLRTRPGTRAVVMTRLGYRTALESWEVGSQSLDAGMIELHPDAILLEALQVTADRVEQQRRAVPYQSVSFGLDDLAVNGSFNAADFVASRVPSVSCGGAERACVRVRGAVVHPCVVVDDAPMAGGMSMLTAFQSHDFARMNVYRGGAFIQAYTPGYLERMATNKLTPADATIQMSAHCRFSRVIT